MEYSAHKSKSSNVDSSGQRCTRTPRGSSEGVDSANSKEAPMLVMQCPYTTTYLMCGALTSWDRFKSPKIVNTSSSLLTTYKNGWKHYPTELLMPGMQGRCFMK